MSPALSRSRRLRCRYGHTGRHRRPPCRLHTRWRTLGGLDWPRLLSQAAHRAQTPSPGCCSNRMISVGSKSCAQQKHGIWPAAVSEVLPVTVIAGFPSLRLFPNSTVDAPRCLWLSLRRDLPAGDAVTGRHARRQRRLAQTTLQAACSIQPNATMALIPCQPLPASGASTILGARASHCRTSPTNGVPMRT
jgi:hypothetical protein